MKKLARKLRKNSEDGKFSLPVHDEDSRPLDSQEQEELVRSLEKTQAQQSRFWRNVFVALVICYILFLLYSIFHQVSSPWELHLSLYSFYSICCCNSLLSDEQRHHAYFMKEMYSWMIICADSVAVLAFSFAIIGLHHESMHHRRWIWYSWYISTVLAVFWLYYMSRLAKFRWDIIWLPLGPLSASTICLYVDHLLTESSEEVKKLHGYMYAYKAN
ncbi:hypothetical protein KIW84_070550 [Lathyrus oleraceus]|uniref:Uncharacterized protein n=1 Tax=Pisum sativum TaxID=3888 RepID=A0A9D4ZUQ3_PEA|nr:hypothetical protein KIW84_070550 [Pisum sativum]